MDRSTRLFRRNVTRHFVIVLVVPEAAVAGAPHSNQRWMVFGPPSALGVVVVTIVVVIVGCGLLLLFAVAGTTPTVPWPVAMLLELVHFGVKDRNG
ncbi:hypothetical protein Tco_0099623 [Tanacetum coccineum]